MQCRPIPHARFGAAVWDSELHVRPPPFNKAEMHQFLKTEIMGKCMVNEFGRCVQ